jgi:hypothetical protein
VNDPENGEKHAALRVERLDRAMPAFCVWKATLSRQTLDVRVDSPRDSMHILQKINYRVQ